MAQGDKPSFIISFIPDGDNKSWNQIGAFFLTKDGDLHTGEIQVPMAAIATGSIRVALRKFTPKDA